MIISGRSISKSFSHKDIFLDCSFTINEKEKVAIIGPNGSGKTTLLKMMNKQLAPDQGSVVHARHLKLGYLDQLAFEVDNKTVFDYLNELFSRLNDLKDQIVVLENKLQDDPHDESSLNAYARLSNEFEMLGGYFIQAKMDTIVSKMGFSKTDMHKQVKDFSGGEKTRLALTMLLLSYPDVLILDEPTNHLDLEMIEWLESFLISYPKAVIFVSHDRRFIDQVAQVVFAIENYQLMRYSGNYSAYLLQHQQMLEKQKSAYVYQQREIKRLEALIEKFRHNKNKAAFAQSKIKYLERMDRIEKPKSRRRSLKMLFAPRLKGAKEVLFCDDLQFGYDVPLARVDFTIHKGQKIAIVGPNGVGKSTLLKTISQEIKPLGGDIIFGHQIEMGYFDQQLAQLDSDKSVLEELWLVDDELSNTEIRQVLAQFQFYQDDVFKLVSQCSGGEKVRLTLAKLMLKRANFLVLDEPTNHLDIQAKEALEASLKAYDGTILFVSHDRYFLDAVANVIWRFEASQLIMQTNLSAIAHEVAVKQEKEAQKQAVIQARVAKRQQTRTLKRLETSITKAEAKLETLRELRFDPQYYHDFKKMNALYDRIDNQHNEIAKLLKAWETIMETIQSEGQDESI